MSMFSILRRNWALRVSVVLNICVLLYVCAHFGSSGPWIEEPPTNWAAPLQSETFGAVDLVNGTQKGATSSIVPATKDANGKGSSSRGGNTTSLARARLLTTRPTPNEAKVESVDKTDQRRNQTVGLAYFRLRASDFCFADDSNRYSVAVAAHARRKCTRTSSYMPLGGTWNWINPL